MICPFRFGSFEEIILNCNSGVFTVTFPSVLPSKPGASPKNIWGRACAIFPKTLFLFQAKICNFSYPGFFRSETQSSRIKRNYVRPVFSNPGLFKIDVSNQTSYPLTAVIPTPPDFSNLPIIRTGLPFPRSPS